MKTGKLRNAMRISIKVATELRDKALTETLKAKFSGMIQAYEEVMMYIEKMEDDDEGDIDN